MTRPARLALLSAVAVLVIAASAAHLLQPRLVLPGGQRAARGQAILRISGLTIPSVPLTAAEESSVSVLLRDGVAVESIGEAKQQQTEFGKVAHFLSLQTLDGELVLGVPAHPPIYARVCQAADGGGYTIALNGTTATEHSRYPQWWLMVEGSVAMTTSASLFAQLRHAGATAIDCTDSARPFSQSGVLHISGVDIQAPNLLPAEVDSLHRLIVAGLQPTEADRISTPTSALFVHLRSGAIVLGGSCDDVRAAARATHMVGGGDPFAPDFLAIGRLGDMAAGTNDRAVWETLQPSTQPC